MTEERNTCPDAARLQDFCAGRLDEPTARRVTEHVETCGACRAELAELSEDERFARELHDLLPGGSDLKASERRPPRLPGFEIGEELGHGGMGVVWEGRDAELGRVVAVKVLHEELAKSEAALKRFVTEARITGQLQHPGIVPVYRLGVAADGRPFLSMKLVRGRTLQQILSGREASDANVPELLTIFQRICEAVSYAHSRGVVHRDLKPANVMVGSFGEVQVLDWGLAKVLDEEDTDPDASVITPVSPDSAASPQSVAGTVMGTPSYMSPEQASGNVETVSQRSDVFSLGAILAELLTGLRPTRKQDGLCGLEECDADWELVELTRSCLAQNPDERPGDAGQVARAISSYLSSVDERARDAELEAAAARAGAEQERKARRRTAVLASAVVVALLVASIALRQTWKGQALAAERTAGTLANAESLFGKGNYEDSAEVARAGLPQAAGSAEESALRLLMRNADLMTRLDKIRPRGSAGDLDEVAHLEVRTESNQAFLDHGINVLTTTTDKAATHLKDAGIGDLVRPVLDDWARTESWLGGWDSENGRQLLALAAALDDEPTRRKLRETLRKTTERQEFRPFLAEGADSLDPTTLALLFESLNLIKAPSHMMWSSYVSWPGYPDARTATMRVHEQYPDDVGVLMHLAALCYYLGTVEYQMAPGVVTPKARTFFHEAAEYVGGVCALDPEYAPAWAVLAEIYGRYLDDEPRSDDAFSEALRRMTRDRSLDNRILSRQMVAFGATDRVIEHLDTLLKEQSDASDLWSELAWNLCHSGSSEDLPRALVAAQRALEIDPDERAYQQMVGIAQFYNGMFGECADTLIPLAEGVETAFLGLMRAICIRELGMNDEGVGLRMLQRMEGRVDAFNDRVFTRGKVLFGQ